MQSHNKIKYNLERYLLNKLYDHVGHIDRDLQGKIEQLRSSYKRYDSVGGGERVDRAISRQDNIMSYIDSKSIKSENVDQIKPMIDMLQSFQSNVKNVMNQIEDIHKDTTSFQALDLSNARFDTEHHRGITLDDMYSGYLEKLAAYNKDYPLEVMKDSSGNISFVRQDTDLDFTGLLEIFRPLIASYDTLRDAIRDNRDLPTVLNTIRNQSSLDVRVLRHAQDALTQIVKKLQDIEPEFQVKKYQMVGQDDSLNDSSIRYSVDEDPTPYNIPVLDKSSVDMSYFTTRISIDSPDSLEAIKLDSMRIIQDYIELLDPLEPVDIEDDRLDLPSIMRDLERITAVDGRKDQLGGNHEQDTSALTQTAVYNEIYSLVSQLIDINRHLVKVRQIIDQTLLNRERKMFYLMYLTQVGTMNDVSDLEIYRYIDRDTVEFYLEIVNDIMKRIDLLGVSRRVDQHSVRKDRSFLDAEYFRSYHFYMLRRVKNLLEFVSGVIGPDKIINLREIEGPIYGDFVVFNHFKDILKSYHDRIRST